MLALGPITFDAYELPTRLGFGGRQRIATHQLPDGTRVLDVLGRDDGPLRWTGMFSGPAAPARARALDLLRAEGGVWPLSWDAFCYLVVIDQLSLGFERPNWVTYRISCMIIADQSAGVGIVAPDVAVAAALIAADIAAVGGFGFDATRSAAVLVGDTQTALGGPMPDATNAAGVFASVAAAGAVAQAAAARGYAQRALTNSTNGS